MANVEASDAVMLGVICPTCESVTGRAVTRVLRAALSLLLVAVAFRLTVAGLVSLSDLHEPSGTTIPVVDTTPTRDRVEVSHPLTVRT